MLSLRVLLLPLAALLLAASPVACQTYTSYQAFTPLTIYVDAAGNMYAFDSAITAIVVLDSTGVQTRSIDLLAATGFSYISPTSLALDSASNIWISNQQNIIQLANNGALLSVLDGGGKFQLLSAIVLDSAGSIYVSDQAAQEIWKLDPTGSSMSGFSDTVWNGLSISPTDMTIDSTGNLFVIDESTFSVLRMTTAGTILSYINITQPFNVSDFSWLPNYITTDSSNNLYVVNQIYYQYYDGYYPEFFNGNQITVYSSSGAVVLTFNDTALGQAWDPQGIAVDNKGHILVADPANGGIQQFSASTGTYITTFTNGGVALQDPLGIAIDALGFVYISDQGSNTIVKINSAGETISTFKATSADLYWSNGAIQVDNTGNIYVADNSGQTVVKLDSTGAFLQFINASNQLSIKIDGIRLDSSNNLYITDLHQNVVFKVAPNNNVLANFSADLQNPTDVALDAAGNVYILDPNNARVQVVAQNGTLIATLNTTNPPLANPQGLAIDPRTNYVYIADTYNGRIVVLSPSTGALLATFNTTTRMTPQKIAFDAAGDLWVADNGGTRVINFHLATSPPHWISASSSSSSSTGGAAASSSSSSSSGSVRSSSSSSSIAGGVVSSSTATGNIISSSSSGSASSTGSSPVTSSSDSSSSGLSNGALAGVIVGCVIGGLLIAVAILAALVCYGRRRAEWNKKKQATNLDDRSVDNSETVEMA